MREDGKRPDGTTILPWATGKPLAWDFTVPDTFADAHVINSAREAGAAAEHAATNKTTKYSRLISTHIFIQWSSKRLEPGTIKPSNWSRRSEDR